MGCLYIHTVIDCSWKYQQMAQVLPQELQSHLWLHKTLNFLVARGGEKKGVYLLSDFYFLDVLAYGWGAFPGEL